MFTMDDALGRRIKKTDSVDSDNSRLYYYNDNWQVVNEYDASNFGVLA